LCRRRESYLVRHRHNNCHIKQWGMGKLNRCLCWSRGRILCEPRGTWFIYHQRSAGTDNAGAADAVETNPALPRAVECADTRYPLRMIRKWHRPVARHTGILLGAQCRAFAPIVACTARRLRARHTCCSNLMVINFARPPTIIPGGRLSRGDEPAVWRLQSCRARHTLTVCIGRAACSKVASSARANTASVASVSILVESFHACIAHRRLARPRAGLQASARDVALWMASPVALKDAYPTIHRSTRHDGPKGRRSCRCAVIVADAQGHVVGESVIERI